ncbi:hypothetical protein B9Q03_12780 [Candidatus Marsarchaeota G2 archaeon OSP_D]|uniref:Uncharacterized protein n=2 Tax=Candidatus Marsarchaeota group 2 TaxID=2203771 RepID=A0A2R6AER4_9ARCH|nr:MAG: hypothetical protein B9Q03_12780 [Candidatus Marsarchaeota G2 archaeon OSP_D]PSN98572.1 MAG: hypothetical protein B9Q05_12635 [Candidatus Marsarchaeota G2 archaeon ECH_B_1]
MLRLAYPSPTRGIVGEVLGEAQQAHQNGGTHPALFKSTKEALRFQSRVKPRGDSGKPYPSVLSLG